MEVAWGCQIQEHANRKVQFFEWLVFDLNLDQPWSLLTHPLGSGFTQMSKPNSSWVVPISMATHGHIQVVYVFCLQMCCVMPEFVVEFYWVSLQLLGIPSQKRQSSQVS